MRKTREFQRQPWSAIEPYITKLETLDNLEGIGKSLGYSGSSAVCDWRRQDSVPTAAILAAELRILQLGEPPEPKPPLKLLVLTSSDPTSTTAILTIVRSLPGVSVLDVDL